MSRKAMVKAISDAVAEEMRRDSKVFTMGEDVQSLGGGLSAFLGLYDEFGGDRVIDMPIAESGFCHFANGAAVAGYRPVVDLMFSDFATVAMDAIVNYSAKLRYNSNGVWQVPVTFVLGNGGGFRVGANHSQSIEAWFANVPGLKIVAPATPADAQGLMRASIQDNDPVLFLWYEGDLELKGEVPDEEYIIPLNNAGTIVREGTDVTIVAIQHERFKAEKAAKALEKEGISAEIIDPRVLVPLDTEIIINSVKKTGRLVIVHEAPTRGGFGGEIAAIVQEACFEELKAPIKRVGSLNTPVPAGIAEDFVYPTKEKIIAAVKSIV